MISLHTLCVIELIRHNTSDLPENPSCILDVKHLIEDLRRDRGPCRLKASTNISIVAACYPSTGEFMRCHDERKYHSTGWLAAVAGEGLLLEHYLKCRSGSLSKQSFQNVLSGCVGKDRLHMWELAKRLWMEEFGEVDAFAGRYVMGYLGHLKPRETRWLLMNMGQHEILKFLREYTTKDGYACCEHLPSWEQVSTAYDLDYCADQVMLQAVAATGNVPMLLTAEKLLQCRAEDIAFLSALQWGRQSIACVMLGRNLRLPIGSAQGNTLIETFVQKDFQFLKWCEQKGILANAYGTMRKFRIGERLRRRNRFRGFRSRGIVRKRSSETM